MKRELFILLSMMFFSNCSYNTNALSIDSSSEEDELSIPEKHDVIEKELKTGTQIHIVYNSADERKEKAYVEKMFMTYLYIFSKDKSELIRKDAVAIYPMGKTVMDSLKSPIKLDSNKKYYAFVKDEYCDGSIERFFVCDELNPKICKPVFDASFHLEKDKYGEPSFISEVIEGMYKDAIHIISRSVDIKHLLNGSN